VGRFCTGDLDLFRQGHRIENGVYLGNGEELNMRYSNHYCSPWGGEFNGVLQFDLDPIFKVKFRKFVNMLRKHRSHSDVTGDNFWTILTH
jgi:hypothetical protein